MVMRVMRESSRRRAWAVPAALIVVGMAVAACSSPAAIPPTSSGGTAPTGSAPTQSPQAVLNEGIAAVQKGDSSTGENDFNLVIAADPTNQNQLSQIAYYDLGVLNQSRGDTAAAETDYRAAIKLDPAYVAATYNLALEETPSDPQGAIALYHQVIVVDAYDANAMYNLGLLLIKTGQHAAGEGYLNQAIKLQPSLAQKLAGSGTKP
jgi:tetratricopeptide (TPR) repeat protein